MITRADIVERVAEWQLTEEVIEKDYVLGWLLWGIGADPTLGSQWVFKGGTCLKKCYIETYRFSEDLDFTVLPGGPIRPEDVGPLLDIVLARVQEASGIDFSARAPALRLRPGELTAEGRVYYIGPRGHTSAGASEAGPGGRRKSRSAFGAARYRTSLPRRPFGGQGAVLLIRGTFRREIAGHRDNAPARATSTT